MIFRNHGGTATRRNTMIFATKTRKRKGAQRCKVRFAQKKEESNGDRFIAAPLLRCARCVKPLYCALRETFLLAKAF